MLILFAESDFWIKRIDLRERYAKVIRKAFEDARELLPEIPEDVTFVNQVAPWECIPEYGTGAYTKNSQLILLSVDDGLPFGEGALLEYTRQGVFHELSHAARFNQELYHPTFIDICIFEGLATVFEREYAPAKPLYGKYNHEVEAWLQELQDNESVNHYDYMFRHPDGRRWIGYKVGTYIVDQAQEKSGKSILELTLMECDDILRLAEIDRG